MGSFSTVHCKNNLHFTAVSQIFNNSVIQRTLNRTFPPQIWIKTHQWNLRLNSATIMTSARLRVKQSEFISHLKHILFIYFHFPPTSGERNPRPQSRLMSASIFSYFQPAVSGLLMKSFTVNSIQTAETETDRDIPAVLICVSSAQQIKTETAQSGLQVFPGKKRNCRTLKSDGEI